MSSSHHQPLLQDPITPHTPAAPMTSPPQPLSSSPILSTNTSQFSSGSCLDLSFCVVGGGENGSDEAAVPSESHHEGLTNSSPAVVIRNRGVTTTPLQGKMVKSNGSSTPVLITSPSHNNDGNISSDASAAAAPFNSSRTPNSQRQNSHTQQQQEKISTPKHLFHENVLWNDNSLTSSFEVTSPIGQQNGGLYGSPSMHSQDTSFQDENSNSFLSNQADDRISSPVMTHHSVKSPSTRRSLFVTEGVETPRKKNSVATVPDVNGSQKRSLASSNHQTFRSSPIVKMAASAPLSQKKQSSEVSSAEHSDSPVCSSQDSRHSQSAASPQKPIKPQALAKSSQQNNTNSPLVLRTNGTVQTPPRLQSSHSAENLMLSPLLSPTKSIHSTSQFPSAAANSSSKALQKNRGASQLQEANFLDYVTNLFDQQRRINVMNMKLNCVNLFANFANILKTNALQHRCTELSEEAERRKIDCDSLRDEVNRGKEHIQQLEGTVDQNQQIIDNLNSSVNNLNQSVHEQSQKLEYASNAYTKSLKQLEQSLGYYKSVLAQYEASKLKRDFAFDGSLFVASLYVVNTYIVNLPLNLIITLMRFQRRPTARWVKFFCKTVVMLCMFIGARRFAIKYHMHSAVGSFSTYGAHLLHGLFDSVTSVAYSALTNRGGVGRKQDDSLEHSKSQQPSQKNSFQESGFAASIASRLV